MRGSLLRVPLSVESPTASPLVYSDEVLLGLWPDFHENQKRRLQDPVRVRLPDGQWCILSLRFLGPGVWGSLMPELLRDYLVEQDAAAGDALLIRLSDGEGEENEAWLESRTQRDTAKVARRNRELADTASQFLQTSHLLEVPIWHLVVALLARGVYRGAVVPDPVEVVLSRDQRFVDAGLNAWCLSTKMTPEIFVDIQYRKQFADRFLKRGY